jgi:hypothetical protein
VTLPFSANGRLAVGFSSPGSGHSAAIVNLFMSVISRLISFQNLSFTHSPVV